MARVKELYADTRVLSANASDIVCCNMISDVRKRKEGQSCTVMVVVALVGELA